MDFHHVIEAAGIVANVTQPGETGAARGTEGT